MPRGPRLDAPGVLHHLRVRGLERRAIFRDDQDRGAFRRHRAALVAAGALRVDAWSLWPNHAHLLVRTGEVPVARSRRALLAGEAGAVNRRHRRVVPVQGDPMGPAPRTTKKPIVLELLSPLSH